MLGLGALAGPLLAVAVQAAPLVVVEGKVEQYRTAAAAVAARLPDAAQVEPADPALADKVHAASVVVAVGRNALAAAKAQAGKKPVVFCMVLGVTEGDFSDSVTGVPLESDPKEMLGRIRAVLPKAKTVGVVYDPKQSGMLIERAKAAASAAGLTLTLKPVSGGAAARDAYDEIASSVDALWLPPDPKLYSRELSTYLLTSASERRLPLFGFLESFTRAGALASVSPNYADVGDRAGQLAATIAAKPEAKQLPVPGPVYAPGDLSLNLSTARALGLEIPQAAVASAGSHVVR
jgi:putative ABC transport system substrate-binding protein